MQCAITEDSFSVEYSALTNNMGIYDPETGQSCSLYDLMNGQWPAGREFAGNTGQKCKFPTLASLYRKSHISCTHSVEDKGKFQISKICLCMYPLYEMCISYS